MGARLDTVASKRAEFDPENRLLNEYFRTLFGVRVGPGNGTRRKKNG